MKRISLSALSALLLVSCAPKVSETTVIHGRIEGGTADKVTVYVLDYDIRNVPLEITDGMFRYEMATHPGIVATFTCYFDGERISQALIPDGSDLALVFSPNGATLASSNKKSVNYKFLKLDRIEKVIRDIASEYLSQQLSGAPEEQLDSLAGLTRPVQEKLQTLSRENLEKEKDNYLSVAGLNALQALLTDEQKDSLINTLDSAVIKTARIQMMKKDIQGRLRTKEGMAFVDFSVPSGDGTVRLSDYVGKGKYILADFWASWCQPCLAEMPLLKELYEKYDGDDFTILGIAVSDRPEDSRGRIRELKLPWEQILGTGDVAMEAYGINAIPHVVLFGPDGTILKRDLRGKQIEEALKTYLNR